MNLKTPVPDWMGSAGKTKINLSPYSKAIAETLSSLAKKMPSYHGMTNSLGYEYYREYKKTATDHLRDFIRERIGVVGADASLKTRDRITQSGVWYRTRPKMIAEGFQPEISWGKTRRSFTSSIKRMCEEEFGIDMEDLGIVASARAIMFYNGEQIPVDIDSIQTLATKGIAVIFVEKEGIPQVLADEARKYGIAIVNTRGRLTEYGQELIDAVVDHGSIAVILVDYDLVGDDIARRTGVPKIGITRDTITWLQQNVFAGLTEAQVEEAYEPPPGISTDEEYLKHKRIELDAIVALPEIGPQGLWKYVMFQLQKPEFSPNGFDLIDEVDIPADEAFYPEVLNQIRNFLDRHIDRLHKDELADIKDELTCVRELRELKDVEEEISQRLGGLVAKDEKMKKITSILNRALGELELG